MREGSASPLDLAGAVLARSFLRQELAAHGGKIGTAPPHQQDRKVMCNIWRLHPVWSLILHRVTGELKWAKKREDLHAMPQPDRNSYQVDVRREATSVRAFMWPEGSESMAKEINPEISYDILEQRHELENSHVHGPNPSDSADRKLNVRDMEFTQASIAPRFRDGRYLANWISELNGGKLDPC
eukprot:s512_g28.t1